MAKRKTTVYLDEDVLRGVKVLAARTDRSDSEVFDAAVRAYLGLEVLSRIWAEGDLSDTEALRLAYREIDAARSAAPSPHA